MKRKLNKKGFTLAELLIVVAIIGVLVAISIPIFNNQLRKARFATNLANARAAKAAVIAGYFDTNETRTNWNYDIKTGSATKPWYDNAYDRTRYGKTDWYPTTSEHPERGVITSSLSDPSTWHFNKMPALGDRVYSVIGIDLNRDGTGTVREYYFYK